MNTMTQRLVVALALAALSAPVFADSVGDVDCHEPKYANIMRAEKKHYEDMIAHDKAGEARQAYDLARNLDARCVSKNEKEIARVEATQQAVLDRTTLKLGQQAENKGQLAEAYKYFSGHNHGIDADRVQMKMATVKPHDFDTVRASINYFRGKQQYLNDAIAMHMKTGVHRFDGDERMDPNRDARLKAFDGYLAKLKAIATKQGDGYLADEDKVFGARKASMTSKRDSLAELGKAREWFRLAGQERRADDRALKRGDTLLADDSRKSLELAISYYGMPSDDLRDKRVQKVRDKARRLGDAHLAKGEKKIAADYYKLAGLGDKASKLEEANEVEKKQTETKRQGTFKKDQKSLEKELGF